MANICQTATLSQKLFNRPCVPRVLPYSVIKTFLQGEYNSYTHFLGEETKEERG